MARGAALSRNFQLIDSDCKVIVDCKDWKDLRSRRPQGMSYIRDTKKGYEITYLKLFKLLFVQVDNDIISVVELITLQDMLVLYTRCGSAIKCGRENISVPKAIVMMPQPIQEGLCP